MYIEQRYLKIRKKRPEERRKKKRKKACAIGSGREFAKIGF